MMYFTPAILKALCNPNTPSLPFTFPNPVSQADKTTWKAPSNRTSPGRFQNQPAAVAAVTNNCNNNNNYVRGKSETRAFGSGPGPGYTSIQSQPGSPMQEQSPLYWFVRDIDIGDTSSTKSAGPHRTNPNLPRTRSRHECHFSLGSACLGGGGKTTGPLLAFPTEPNGHSLQFFIFSLIPILPWRCRHSFCFPPPHKRLWLCSPVSKIQWFCLL